MCLQAVQFPALVVVTILLFVYYVELLGQYDGVEK